ncbi:MULTISPECIES: hypothetical protein [unclassified Streptomyces]|uniref:hypothetical protein n=1 Tax=unclassified Streptomyces TaxID=2593676 RepID=UPI0033DAAF5D
MSEVPAKGRREGVEYAVDTANNDRIGVVEGRFEGSVYLRPPGGGTQWATAPDALRPARLEELVRARVLNTPVAPVRGWR